jgi:hypothetical protein
MNGAKYSSRIHPALFYSPEIHFRAGKIGCAEVFDQLLNALVNYFGPGLSVNPGFTAKAGAG